MAALQGLDDGPLAGDGADRLLAYFRTALGRPDLEYAQPPARLSGGNETFIYGLRLQDAPSEVSGPLILRAYRQGYSRPDQARFEATVQNAIAGLGYSAARVFFVSPEPTVLGTPFIVMERLAGVLLLEGIGELDEMGTMRFREGGRLLRGIGLLEKIPRICAEAQLGLHALDAQRLFDAIARAGLPQSSVTLGGRLTSLRDCIETADLNGLCDAYDWLIAKQPKPERLAICHCDMQPNNILMTGTTITGVVDWSQVLVADPALDVGYTKVALETAPLKMPRFLQWLVRPVTGLV